MIISAAKKKLAGNGQPNFFHLWAAPPTDAVMTAKSQSAASAKVILPSLRAQQRSRQSYVFAEPVLCKPATYREALILAYFAQLPDVRDKERVV